VLRKYLVAAVVAVVALAAAAAAYALTAADSTFSLRASASPTNSGDREQPKSERLKLIMDGGLKPGRTGQPETTDKIRVTTPSEWQYRGEDWPRRDRCDSAAANRAKSNRGCPARSKVGSGLANLLAGSPPLATPVKRTLNLTIHVIRNGNLGIWAQSPAGESPSIAQFIGSSVRGNTITFDIPPNLETPLNVKSSIDKLTARFGGTTRARGDRIGILESTRCRDRRWTTRVLFDTFTGNLSDSVNIRCRP
jgi:hypothetical protein